MPIQNVHSYLVHPGKGDETLVAIGGSKVPHTGRLFGLLNDVYVRSDTECTIDISFNQGADGKQSNPCRSLLLSHIKGPTLDTGKVLAERLATVTTRRSGMGLMFLLVGTEGKAKKAVVSRFPAHSAILAEAKRSALTLEFLERVFMKSAHTYKAVVYSDTSLTSGFWYGKAIDKQIDSRELEVSRYWIKDFLDSDFRTTPARGTRRLADAMKSAANKSNDLTVKREIAAAVTLAPGLSGKNMSVDAFMDQFKLSQVTREAIIRELPNARIAGENFKFEAMVFDSQVPYRSIELNSGAMLTAPSRRFNDLFTREAVEGDEGMYRYTTIGSVVNERIAKKK